MSKGHRKLLIAVGIVILSLATPITLYAINQMNRLPYLGNFRVSCGWHESCFPTYTAGKGLDFSMTTGQTIYSTASGTVHAIRRDATGWGYQVIVRTGDGGSGCYYHRYAHLYNDGYSIFVIEAMPIGKGSPIAYSDNTGQSSNPHLHYEIYHTNSCSSPDADLNSANSVYAATDTEPIYGYNADESQLPTYYYKDFPGPGVTISTTTYQNYSFPGSTKLTDDGDTRFTTTGVWTVQQVGFDKTHRNSRDMRWVNNTQSGSTASASWQGGVSSGGVYRIYAFIPSNYATTTNAHYRVTYYDPGSGTYPTYDVYKNQNAYYNQWVSLGLYCGRSNDYPCVTLYNDTGEANGATRVGADAMMWVRVSTSCGAALMSKPDEESIPFTPGASVPEIELAKSSDLSWLNAGSPKEITWKEYAGKFEGKDFVFGYQLSYPDNWIIYPHDSTVQIQTFPQFETSDQTPRGFAAGYMKIDVGFEPPCASPDTCQLLGRPVTVAGMPGAAAAYADEVVPDLQIRTVAVQNGKAILRITAFMNGNSDQIKLYEQIFGYMISTLKFGG